MQKKLVSLLVALVLVLSSTTFATAAGADPGKKDGKSQVVRKLSKLSNGKLTLNQKDNNIFLSGKLSDKKTANEASAVQFLNDNKALFGIADVSKQLKPKGIKKEKNGNTFVQFDQTIKDTPVYGGELNVHFKDGVVTSVMGRFIEDQSVTTLGSKAIAAKDAIAAVKGEFTFDTLEKEPQAEKFILNKDGKNYLVYRVNICSNNPKFINSDVFVEAYSGKIISVEDNIRTDSYPTTGTGVDVMGGTRTLQLTYDDTPNEDGSPITPYWMIDQSRADYVGYIGTYDMGHATGGSFLPVSSTTNVFDSENYKASVNAHYFAGVVADFYNDLFDRDSLDGAGMPIISFTHFGEDYVNAFWTGSVMVYGDGDLTPADAYTPPTTYFSADLDVVGHEMTHGVIENTANLQYHNQSGALNESFADVFGVLIETYEKYDVAGSGSWAFNPDDWKVGDEVCLGDEAEGMDAFRSLSDPNAYGQPDRMSQYWSLPDSAAGDNGGVHFNSGIPNKAAYLIASELGMAKTAQIYYWALDYYLSPYSVFEDARYALAQAARDIYGDSVETQTVDNAFAQVGVGPVSVFDPYEPNNTLATAYNIYSGRTYQAYCTSYADSDLYKIKVNVTGNLNIDLTDLPDDFDLYLYDSDGVQLDQSEEYDTADEHISFTNAAPGWYYIEVYPWDLDRGMNLVKKYSLVATAPGDAVTGVSLSAASLNLLKGQTTQLNANVSPSTAANQNVVWSSSNPAAVTVSASGLVTAAGNGTADITVVTIDGGFIATSRVIVASLGYPGYPKAASYAYNSVKVSWNKIAYATGYQVYRSTSKTGTYTYAGSTTGAYLVCSGLTTNTTYYFKVRAYKSGGSASTVYGPWSTIVYAKPIPAAPTAVAASRYSSSSIRISWGAVSGASGYELYRATSRTGTYSRITTTASRVYVNTGLTRGRYYYYKVRAYRTVGKTKVYGPYSAIVYAKPY